MAELKPLVKRTIGGLLLAVVLIGSVMLHPLAFAAVFVFGMSVMFSEFYSITLGKGKKRAERVVLTIFADMLFLLCVAVLQYGLHAKFLLAALPAILLIFILILFRSAEGDWSEIANLAFPVVYIAVPFSVTTLLLYNGGAGYSPLLFLVVLILVWMNDIGGYAVGMLLGQKEGSRKIAPKISPKKSVAGVWGSLLFTLTTAFAITAAGVVEIGYFHIAVIALITVSFGIFGDLFESLIKRRYGVKDSGRILLGHGGILDRFDGALFVFPAVTAYLMLVGVL